MKKQLLNVCTAILVIQLCLNNAPCAFALDKLATQAITGGIPMTQEGRIAQGTTRTRFSILGVSLKIGEYLLGTPGVSEPGPLEYLHSTISRRLHGALGGVDTSKVRLENDIVLIPFEKMGIIQVALKNTPSVESLTGQIIAETDSHIVVFAPNASIAHDKHNIYSAQKDEMKVDITSELTIDDFKDVPTDPGNADTVRNAAEYLKNRGIKNISLISSTRQGGGVAEMMGDIVALFRDAGLDTNWFVIEGSNEFFDITTHIHEALHSRYKSALSLDEISIFERTLINNFIKMEDSGFFENSDAIVIEDPQIIGMVPLIRAIYPHIPIIWGCHIDTSTPNQEVADLVSDLVSGELAAGRDHVLYDYLEERLSLLNKSIGKIPEAGVNAATFHMQEFSEGLSLAQKGIPIYTFSPSINPFGYKNRPVPDEFIKATMLKYGLSPDKFMTLEVSRFDPYKGPLEAMHAYTKFIMSLRPEERDSVQCVYAGNTANDNNKGKRDLPKMQAYLKYLETKHPEIKGKIFILALEDKEDKDGNAKVKLNDDQSKALQSIMPESEIKGLTCANINHLEVNALQSQLSMPEASQKVARKVVIQPSSREGFGLVVAEALIKGTLVIASLVGGIKTQIKEFTEKVPWLGLNYSEGDVSMSHTLYESMDHDQLAGTMIDNDYFKKRNIYENIDKRDFVKDLGSSIGKAYDLSISDPEEYQRLCSLGPEKVFREFVTLVNVKNRMQVIENVIKEWIKRGKSVWMSGEEPIPSVPRDYFNNRKSHMIAALNRIINSLIMAEKLDKSFTVLRVEETDTAYETMSRITDILARIHALDQSTLGPNIIQQLSEIEENLDGIEAHDAIASIAVLSENAKDANENNTIIIGYETDWIPGYEKGKRQHGALNPLVTDIDNLGEHIRKRLGIKNVRIVHSPADRLAADLLEEARITGAKLSNVIALASQKTIESPAFGPLRGMEGEDRPFLAQINTDKLLKTYEESDELIDKLLYIEFVEMLTLTLELASGKEAPNLAIIEVFDGEKRFVVFAPMAEKVEYEELIRRYRLKRLALQSA